jgi:hypothetical protein
MNKVRILWVCRKVINRSGGDAVYDRKAIMSLPKRLTVELLPIAATRSALTKLIRAVRHNLPHDRAPYFSSATVSSLSTTLQSNSFDVVVVSHESLDWVATLTDLPVVFIAHNVTSEYAYQVTRPNILAKMVRSLYQRYELKRFSNRRAIKILTLSTEDKNALLELDRRQDIAVAMPGATNRISLNANPVLEPGLYISGTYGWAPKVRDLLRFTSEFRRLPKRPPIYFLGELPKEVGDMLGASLASKEAGNFRVGVITDRFRAGFKLKLLEYIMYNYLVISFSPLPSDIMDIRGAGKFLRYAPNVTAAMAILDELRSSNIKTFVEDFDKFKSDVSRKFNWGIVGNVIQAAVNDVLRAGEQ